MKMPVSESDEGLNLTPMIDVVFLLLIFFLVATRFDEEERELGLNVPDVAAAQPITMGVPDLIVNVRNDNRIVVAGRELTSTELAAQLRSAKLENPHRRVQIRADEDAKFKFPMTIAGLCRNEDLAYTCSVLQERP